VNLIGEVALEFIYEEVLRLFVGAASTTTGLHRAGPHPDLEDPED